MFTILNTLKFAISILCTLGALSVAQADDEYNKLGAIRDINGALECTKYVGKAQIKGRQYQCSFIDTEVPHSGEYFNYRLFVQNPQTIFTFGLFEHGSEKLTDYSFYPGFIYMEAEYTGSVYGPNKVHKSMEINFNKDSGELTSVQVYDSRKEKGPWAAEVTCSFTRSKCQ